MIKLQAEKQGAKGSPYRQLTDAAPKQMAYNI